MIRKISKIDEGMLEELRDIRDIPCVDVDIHNQKPLKRLGARGKFQPYMVDEVLKLARFGLTNPEIAEFYGIPTKVFDRYVTLYQDLSHALHEGRMIDGFKLIENLHRQALGYEVEEVSEDYQVTAEGGEKLKFRKVTKKHIQGNVAAAIYLLKCRFPERWSDTQKIENNTKIDVSITQMNMTDMSMEELLVMKKIGLKTLPIQSINPKSN